MLEDNGEIVATAMISKELISYNYIEGNGFKIMHDCSSSSHTKCQKGKGLAKIIIDEGLKLYPTKYPYGYS
ncbi:MAG: hypothetical protein ACLRWM_04315 [Streptococcus sp.]